MNDKVSNEHEKLTDLGRIRWYEFGGPIRCLISVYEIGGRLYPRLSTAYSLLEVSIPRHCCVQ